MGRVDYNRSGYKVMISSAGADSILKPSQSDNTGRIMPLNTSKTLANFSEKEWGVSIIIALDIR